MTQAKKESKKGLKRSEAREHRVKLLACDIRSWLVTREFKLHRMYEFMAEDIMTNLSSLTQTINNRPTMHTDVGTLMLEYDHRRSWTMNLLTCDKFGIDRDGLEELIWKMLDSGETWKLRRELRGSLPDAPETFYRTPERFNLGQRSMSPGENRFTDTGEDKPSDVQMIVMHLATMIIAYTMQKNIESGIRPLIDESVVKQTKAFVLTGKLKYLGVPTAFMSDNNDGLILKYAKYCRFCGKRIHGCFCHEVDDEDGFNVEARTLSTECWPCTKEMIRRAFMREFDETFTKEECEAERDSYFEGYIDWVRDQVPEKIITTHESVFMKDVDCKYWVEQYGKWFRPRHQHSDAKVGEDGLTCGICQHYTDSDIEPDWKVDEKSCGDRSFSDKIAQSCQGFKLTNYKSVVLDWKEVRQPNLIDKLHDVVSSYYADGCDGDPEESCSCPAWGGGDE